MKRLERLHAIVTWLRARSGPATVSQLAERFDVSERTMFRDLAALREGDVPIESDPGPMGGVRLARSWHLPPIGIAIDEALALWIAVQLARGPTADRLAAALDKVLAGTPDDRRASLRRVIDRIIVGPPAPAAIPDPVAPDAEVYRTCERALVNSRTLEIDYVDRRGSPSQRRLEPHGLLLLDPVWYLLALDRERGAPRTFRIDRIRAARMGIEPFDPMDLRTLFPCRDVPV